MHYVGLDVHMRSSSLEMLDDHGKTVKRLTIQGTWPKLIEAVQRLPRPLQVCYEAWCGYGYLHERLGRVADRVLVAHPGQLRVIYQSKRKNDRLDAQKLAKLLYLDLVPQVHVPSLHVRQWRRLIEFRQKLLQRRVMVKNQLRAILRSLAITPPRGLLWSKKNQRWLSQLELSAAEALERDLLVEELQDLNTKIARVEKELGAIAGRHPAVTLLRTIPGVGIRTAEAFVAYVDDPQRFSRSVQFGSYFGLTPCQDSSGPVNRLGHITRDGPATVRKLLCEAAWQAIRRSVTVRSWFERISGKRTDGRKIALVAVSRKLAVVMGAMLRSGEAWRENHHPTPPHATERPRAAMTSRAAGSDTVASGEVTPR